MRFVFVDGLVSVDSHKVLACGGETAVTVGGRHLYGVILLEAARCLLHHRENLGERGVKITRVFGEHFLAELVYLLPEGFALVIIERLDLRANFLHPLLIVGGFAADIALDSLDAATQLIVRYIAYLLRDGIDFCIEAVPERTHGAFRLVAKYFLKYIVKHIFRICMERFIALKCLILL